METITIPARLLERVREIPGADDMTDSQLVSLCMEAGLAAAKKGEATAARSILVKTLLKLSDDALAYVWRPIMYPYLWTDGHGHDRLTDDDMRRMNRSGVIAHGSPKLVETLDRLRLGVERSERKVVRA